MYQKLIEVTVNAVLEPDSYISLGMSYEVPLYYGVLNKQMLMDQRDSSTMSDESFLRESMSVYTGNNSEAWLDSKRLNKLRTLLNCERRALENPQNPDTFYILGVDIGRYRANTAIMVIKVLPGKENFKKKIVHTEVINGANYITEQVPRIKKLIQLYQPREVVIDGNGRDFLARLASNCLD